MHCNVQIGIRPDALLRILFPRKPQKYITFLYRHLALPCFATHDVIIIAVSVFATFLLLTSCMNNAHFLIAGEFLLITKLWYLMIYCTIPLGGGLHFNGLDNLPRLGRWTW
jgi:hypothetical protein